MSTSLCCLEDVGPHLLFLKGLYEPINTPSCTWDIALRHKHPPQDGRERRCKDRFTSAPEGSSCENSQQVMSEQRWTLGSKATLKCLWFYDSPRRRWCIWSDVSQTRLHEMPKMWIKVAKNLSKKRIERNARPMGAFCRWIPCILIYS